MKKLFLIMAMAALLFNPLAFAKEITVQLEWDPNTEPDLLQYLINHRFEGQTYDYAVPIKVVPAPATTADVTFVVPDGTMAKSFFVARAEDTNENESGDSNEVWVLVDLRKPSAPSTFAGVYDDVTETINFTWDQTDPDLVTKWGIFSSSVSGGPYTQIGDYILNDGSTYSSSWKIPADGDYYFVLVAYREGGDTLSADGQEFTSVESSFSDNSDEIHASVQVHPAPVKTFKVKLRVYQ